MGYKRELDGAAVGMRESASMKRVPQRKNLRHGTRAGACSELVNPPQSEGYRHDRGKDPQPERSQRAYRDCHFSAKETHFVRRLHV